MKTSSTNSATPGTLAQLRLRRPPETRLRDKATALLEQSYQPNRDDLVRLSALDPLMAVWILKRANSSYYGLRSTVDNLARAIDVIEPHVAAGMFADTEGIPGTPGNTPEDEFPDSLTRHSVATALIASWLDDENSTSLGCAFTAGLMHDVGKHVLALNFPSEASKMYSTSTLWENFISADVLTVEQLTFGLDHTEVGEFVARKMQFPEPLTDVLRTHHNPSSLPPYHRVYRMSWIVSAASLCATALGYAAGVSVSWEQCAMDSRWKKLIDEGFVQSPNVEIMLENLRNLEDKIELYLNIFPVPQSRTDQNELKMKRSDRKPSVHLSPTPRQKNQDRIFE